MHIPRNKYLLLLSVLLLQIAHSNARTFQVRNSPQMPTNQASVSADSGAMKELKDKIREQAAEIAELKKTIGKKPSAAPSHGGHGGGEALTGDEVAAYLTRPFYSIATQRVGWLGIFLVSLSLTALIMNGFEHTLSRQLELAYFVPLLAGHGGNTGGQTVGTVLSGLSAGVITLKDAPRVVTKEAMSGIMMGIILGSIVGAVAHYCMGISVHVSTVIFCTLPLVSTIAGIFELGLTSTKPLVNCSLSMIFIRCASYSAPSNPAANSSSSMTVTLTPLGVARE